MIGSMVYYCRTTGWIGLASYLKSKVLGESMLKLRPKCVRHPFYVRMPSADIRVYEKIFLEEEYGYSPGSTPRTIIDAGAHIGLSAIYFANKYPQAMIIAIEPERSNFELLRQNVASYESIIPVQAALWHEDIEITLFDPGGGSWGFIAQGSNGLQNGPGRFHQRVNAMTIERIMFDYKLRNVDILKMDIEGAEREVFEDSSSWIEKVDTVMIELHEHLRPGCSDAVGMASSGFNFKLVQGENLIFSKQNVCR